MMEDLYGNLENYNDLAALEELKTENMELKVKLQDYATAMDKLQKDFDTLSSEFKKLEQNYSSLLKTAKSEIERKTQIITSINMEKDQLILTALQNGNKSVLYMKRNMASCNKNNSNKSQGAVNRKHVKNAKEMQDDQINKNDLKNIRLQEHGTPPHDNVKNVGLLAHTQKQENVNKIAPNIDSCNYVNSHTKKNIQHTHKSIPTTDSPSSAKLTLNEQVNYAKTDGLQHDVYTRGKEDRKANIAPIIQTDNIMRSVQSKCMNNKNRRQSIPATDVEHERVTLSEKADCSKRLGLQQDAYTRDKEDRKSFFKYDNDRHSSKSSERSSRDERILGYCEPTRELDKGRTHKHYDSDKHRSRDNYDTSQRYKSYNHERNKKQSRDYYDDKSHRPGFDRSRIRESSPVDKFYHHSYKEHQVDHERYHFNEHDRYSYRKERYMGKYKIPYEYEEPYTKRQKTDYYGRPKEDKRWYEERTESQELTETFEKLQEEYTSCQSPDDIYSEIDSEPIKVILDTAVDPQEDPRLATNKYIVSNVNGSESLSIANGRNVDLEPIDKIKWQLHNVSVPNALIKPPMEQILKDLYMDIDEPQSKISLETREAGRDLEVVPKQNFTDTQSTYKCNEDNSDKICLTNTIKENAKPTHGCVTNYKIPKIKKCVQETKSNSFVKEWSLEVIEDMCTFDNDKKNDKQNLRSNSKLPLSNLEKHDNISNNDIRSGYKTCGDFQNRNSNDDVHNRPRVLSTREIVEGDLELSDETCDNTELHKSNIICLPNLNDISTFNTVKNCQLEQSDKKNLSKSEPNHNNNTALVEVVKLSSSVKNDEHNEVSKKQKSKKKAHKHKESEHVELIETKIKSKKDKPKEVKAKFNDLFGESNSLITPDDLGISSSQTQCSSHLLGIYVPIFEDAQDATDLEQTTAVKLLPKTKDIDEVNTNIEMDNKRDVDSNPTIEEFKKVVPEVTNYDVKISNESAPVDNTIHENLKLENVNKGSDIVTTIIISSGVQPDEINTESQAESLVNAEELLSEHIEQTQIDATHKSQDVLIKALATSTPHKQVMDQIALELDPKLPDTTLSSNSMLNVDNAGTCVSNTNSTLEPPSEDLPDVRIFVKRRRRVVKNAK